MHCLVTGATGFIGSHVVRLLLEHGAEVAVLVRSTSDRWRIEDSLSRVEVIVGDLANLEQAASAIRDFGPETVFHLGWHGVRSLYRNEAEQVTQNLRGSLALLDSVRDTGCRRWVGLGSQAEYGPHSCVLTEDLPARPITTYGVVKLCVCLLTQKLCETYGIEFTWLRLVAAYGPMDDPYYLIPYTILNLLKGKSPALTNGEQRWDYLYVDDAAKALWQAAASPHAQGVFNLGSGEAYAVRNIVEQIGDLIDPSLPLGFGQVSSPTGQIMNLEIDVSRLKKATGWAPQVSLSEGLHQTVQWFRANGRRYELL